MVKKNWGKGVIITVNETNSIVIECNLIAIFGKNVVETAKAAQVAIINALESLSAIEINSVNVNICGIIRQ